MSAVELDDAPRGFVPMVQYQRLRARCDELEEKVAYLSPKFHIGRALFEALGGLTPRQCKLLGALCDGRVKGFDALLMAMGSDATHALVKCQVHYCRKRLDALGAPPKAILNFWGDGYQLSPEGLAWLRERAPEAFTKGDHR